ncbi:VCBS repeat-containing protein [Microcoleus sp. MON1_C1]|uniref:VCBS repeat-containing protein n=1 Tax=Microcoleus sp. MON1_C1 TaxID=2818827 RepID=UPI002FCF84E3
MSKFSTATNFPAGTNPNSVVVGDFNKDGKLDIATSNGNSSNVSILLGAGTGSFGTAANFNAGGSPASLALGDFNSDGNLDLAAPQSSVSSGETAYVSNDVSILLGTGTGSFGTPTKLSSGANTKPVSVVTGDFDADGKLDLVIANSQSNNVWIRFGNGTGSFTQAPANFDPGPFIPPVGGGFGGTYTNTFKSDFNVGTNPQSVVAGDFNADGKLDVATANSGSNNVSILLGTGTGSFGAATNFNVGTSPSSVTVGDFNSDNKSGACHFCDEYLY